MLWHTEECSPLRVWRWSLGISWLRKQLRPCSVPKRMGTGCNIHKITVVTKQKRGPIHKKEFSCYPDQMNETSKDVMNTVYSIRTTLMQYDKYFQGGLHFWKRDGFFRRLLSHIPGNWWTGSLKLPNSLFSLLIKVLLLLLYDIK